jgi:sterol 3beta-glucosyltransferase
MKFIVATYGTEGDARPFAALCRGLMDAGHEAQLLADAATLGSAHALGVPATALSGDIRDVLAADRAIAGVVAKGGGFNDTTRALAKIANENAASWLRTIIEAGESCDAIVVAGLAAFAGFSSAEYLSIKSIGSGMIPITPTAAFPSPFLPPKLLPRLLNRASRCSRESPPPTRTGWRRAGCSICCCRVVRALSLAQPEKISDATRARRNLADFTTSRI